MKVKELHHWQFSPAQAVVLQRRLASQVCRNGDVTAPRLIAAVDVSVGRGRREGSAAVVVFSYPELSPVETRVARVNLDFPYIPGLLSFRELPLILEACAGLANEPDLFLVDGQGIAHPRRFGLASHLGLFLDRPTIGCAKSRLCGSHQASGDKVGDYAKIVDNGEVIGAALRTKVGVKPVYVSTGHKVSLETAVQWVLNCCRGYRLPEPLRAAHREAGRYRGISV